MKNLELFQELPKCDIETRSEQMLLKKMVPIDLLNTGFPQTFNMKKIGISMKYNKVQ